MLERLISLANELDERGLLDEASTLDKIAGDLISLDQFRGLKPHTPKLPANSDEKAADAESMFFDKEDSGKLIDIIVLDDGETWDGGASIVSLTQDEMDRVSDGEKVFDVVRPDHEVPDAEWRDVWEACAGRSQRQK